MSVLEILQAGPGVTVQDDGRPGYMALGLSRGGAADRQALAEGAALLRQPVGTALELAGFGGRFRVDTPCRIALTGAPMRATLEGAPLAWNASHALPAGAVLEIGGALQGVYGYLTVGGGFDLPKELGARSAHLNAGLGRLLEAGDRLPLGPDTGRETGLTLDPVDRLGGGVLRVLPSLQTEMFPEETRARFVEERFTRDSRGNRMGIRLKPEGQGYGLTEGQSIVSEVITPGDIQIPGDGAPYVLLYECQTTGGYPRIGTVIPADLPRVAQAAPGAELRFRFVSRDEALEAEAAFRRGLESIPVRPLVRDPADMPDLLSYELIGGVTAGEEPS
ncbi:biotin-dependent carboxyltransferase family protein [Mameliella alba]|uniref:5-oxoprolinase subunit C family protein n=1 Tax=Mameliella alba TaxID=561184 RepID=UPI000B52DBD0|nr:biotin-dependent carboxyltransferase family protein [Mameliella alba]MBY6118377.1 biotin-dependent carboxyltransferase family protein [Mameliella alba]OWV43346.1 urea amidolyase [Mameliella alba]OWV68483.1 urea amidolyase [Mameliella alba]